MSIMQQQNAEIGRTGVTPVSDKFAEAQQKGEPIEANPNPVIPGLNLNHQAPQPAVAGSNPMQVNNQQ
jgi:hypothetical protein